VTDAAAAGGGTSLPADSVERVVASIADRRDEIVDTLARLVAFETVSPPARNTDEAQAWFERALSELRFTVDRWPLYPGDSVLAATLPGSDGDRFRSVMLNGHIDVVEPGLPEQWACPPFELTQGPDGRVHGRGVADMKGALAASLVVVRALCEEGVELRGDLQYHVVTGEEAGEAGTLSALERGHRADFAVVTDGSDMHIQGQGGVITGWITISSPETFHDGMRARMLHAGGGLLAASAIEKMMKVVAALQELERHWAVTKSYPGIPLGATTINPAVIEGGRNAAFIADRCALWITVHFHPDERHEDVAREIEEHVLAAAAADPWLRRHPPTFRWGGRSMLDERGEIFPALALDTGHPGIQALADAYRRQVGSEPVCDMSPSVSDVGWFAQAGIPAVLFGPGEIDQAHAVDESADPDRLVTFAQILARFVVCWCNTPR
jgi:acetylornithine deacetylase/succinyl-diaminopimelate desuccinylase family protein